MLPKCSWFMFIESNSDSERESAWIVPFVYHSKRNLLLHPKITMVAAFIHPSLILLIAGASLQCEGFTKTPSLPQLRRIGTAHHLQLNLVRDDTSCASTMPSRRTAVVSIISSTIVTGLLSPAVVSASTSDDKSYVSGIVNLKSGLSIDETIGPNSALYVTARPNKPDNVPKAILDGSRGKPPPVLSARFANPSFPFEFMLTSENFTPEGASKVDGTDDVWWSGEELIVSARLDTDGVAATRDPTDLVGRGIYSAGGASPLPIELVGRGLFGKSVTAKK